MNDRTMLSCCAAATSALGALEANLGDARGALLSAAVAVLTLILAKLRARSTS